MNVVTNKIDETATKLTEGSVADGLLFTVSDGMQFIFPSGNGTGEQALKTDGVCTGYIANAPSGEDGDYKIPATEEECGTATICQIDGAQCEWISDKKLNWSRTNCVSAEPCIIVVDLNGEKGPNSLANPNESNSTIRDRFYIQIYDGTIMPIGDLATSVMYGE